LALCGQAAAGLRPAATTTEWENDMMRNAFPLFGLCLWGAVLAYFFLVATGA
jgi:hypothetical protein